MVKANVESYSRTSELQTPELWNFGNFRVTHTLVSKSAHNSEVLPLVYKIIKWGLTKHLPTTLRDFSVKVKT